MSGKKSAFDTPCFNSQDNNFFNQLNKNKTPRLVICGETEDFDEECIQQFKEEGFDTAYVPMLDDGNDFIQRIHRTGDSFGPAEYYGIVAFGDAGNSVLEAHIKPNNPKLCAIVAYYPSAIPQPGHTKFPMSVKVLVHLAGSEIDVARNTEVLGIQGKRKTSRKRIDPGEGYGATLKLGYRAYNYPGAEPGFAEHDLDEYDPIAESVAFSRTLSTLQKGFRLGPNLEGIRDELVSSTVYGDVNNATKRIRPYGHVINGPTLTGGIGANQLSHFYSKIFYPLPKSISSRLLSRTIGTDRVVDELFVSFVHNAAVPWMLPGIPPTNRRVEIVVVSIMCVRAGALDSEHIYWDQASVLAQVGLLDPKVVPDAMKQKGVKALPIVAAEGARAVKRGSSREINGLLEKGK